QDHPRDDRRRPRGRRVRDRHHLVRPRLRPMGRLPARLLLPAVRRHVDPCVVLRPGMGVAPAGRRGDRTDRRPVRATRVGDRPNGHRPIVRPHHGPDQDTDRLDPWRRAGVGPFRRLAHRGRVTYPPDVALHADTAARTVTGRAELDRTARSAGWTFDTDRRGQPRLRTWPLPATGPVTTVIDCADHGPTGLVATVIVFTADESQLLNIVQASNALATPAVVSATDATSVQLY